MVCNGKSDFVIQWGPNPDQKEYVCAKHIAESIERIPAIEFFVVKLVKLDP